MEIEIFEVLPFVRFSENGVIVRQKFLKKERGAAMAALRIRDIEEIDRDYLTAEEAGEVLGISADTVRRQFEEKNIPIEKFGRNYRILKEPFLKYLRNGSAK